MRVISLGIISRNHENHMYLDAASRSLLIDRTDNFTLYYCKSNSDVTTDDNDLINEIIWVVCTSFQRLPIHLALNYSAKEVYPLIKNIIYEAVNKKKTFLYYIRYEPSDDMKSRLLNQDSKYKYINKIVAVNIREDNFDPIVVNNFTNDEKASKILSLLDAGHNMYIDYLKETIEDPSKLDALLSKPGEILYLSIGGVLHEFSNHGLYKWFRPFVIEHIQSRFQFKSSFGLSFSLASTYIHEKDGYRSVKKFNCKTYQYPFKDMKDGEHEISIIEKLLINN